MKSPGSLLEIKNLRPECVLERPHGDMFVHERSTPLGICRKEVARSKGRCIFSVRYLPTFSQGGCTIIKFDLQ